MESRIIRQYAMATLLLLLLALWPPDISAGDFIRSLQQDLLPVEPIVPRILATESQTGSSRTADGMAVSAIGRSDHLMLYQCRYNPVDWSGDVIAYLAHWENGRLVLGAQHWRDPRK